MELSELKVLVVEVVSECAEATWAWLEDQEGVVSVVQEEERDVPEVARFLTYTSDDVAALGLASRRGALEEALAMGGWEGVVLCWALKAVHREDWAESWKRHWKPMLISKRLWLVPVWEEIPGEADGAEAVVLLDPGLGFGTGSHFTTRYCLEAVSRHVWPGVTVLDLGTGSGVLSVASAKLGAALPVVGVEFDPLALEAARANGRLNQVDEGCLWLAEDLEEWEGPEEPVDLVLANLYSSLLMDLIPRIARWVRVGGRLVVSGLEGQQGPMVRKAFLATRAWDLQDERVGGEWTGLEFLRLG